MTLTAWILWGFLCGLLTGAVVSNPIGFRSGYQAGRQDGVTYMREMLHLVKPNEDEETVH